MQDGRKYIARSYLSPKNNGSELEMVLEMQNRRILLTRVPNEGLVQEDWPKHKKYCKKYNAFKQERLSHVTQNWVKSHARGVFEEIQMMQVVQGLQQKEVVLEVDMVRFENPPIVIKQFTDLVEGDRSGLPDWSDCRNDHTFIRGLKERQENMTNDMLLFIHRSYGCDYGVCSVKLQAL